MVIKTPTKLEEIMHARKSVRKYKEGVVIPREKLEYLLEQATSAPSSSNMQPWRFLVIDNPEAKKELRAIANNQEQVENSSAIIAALGGVTLYIYGEQNYNAILESGYMASEIADHMYKSSDALYGGLPEDVLKNIVTFDAGLISMQIMLLAKDMGYDTVPMGGFDKV